MCLGLQTPVHVARCVRVCSPHSPVCGQVTVQFCRPQCVWPGQYPGLQPPLLDHVSESACPKAWPGVWTQASPQCSLVSAACQSIPYLSEAIIVICWLSSCSPDCAQSPWLRPGGLRRSPHVCHPAPLNANPDLALPHGKFRPLPMCISHVITLKRLHPLRPCRRLSSPLFSPTSINYRMREPRITSRSLQSYARPRCTNKDSESVN